MTTSIVIDASQLVDLALGTPEIGAVNFNLLHSLLHIIINRLSLNSTRIEIGGTQCVKIEQLAKNLPPQPDIQLVEYSITDSNLNLSYKNREFKGRHSLAAPKLVVVVKKQNDVDDIPSIVDLSRTFEAENDNKLFGRVVSTDDFEGLTKKVADMQDAQPDNQQILELSDRIKEAENGIEKITSLINDLAREYSKIEQNVLPFVDCGEISILKNRIDEIQRIIFEETGKVVKETSVAPDDSPSLTAPASLVIDVPTLNSKRSSLQKPISATSNFINEEIRKLRTEIEKIKKQIESESKRGSIETATVSRGENEELPEFRPDQQHFEIIVEKVNRLEAIAENTKKQIGVLTEKQQDLEAAPANTSGASDKIDCATNIDSLKAELANTVEIVNYLMGEKASIVEHIDTMVNDIQQLKEHKLNKDDIDEMLAEKADYNLMERKVSMDVLETTKHEIAKKLDAISEKFQINDLSLQETMNELQQLFAAKLDKEEIPPLKEYFNEKFQVVQSRLKALALIKPDTEAAGTKTKFLRDVNCISCDNPDVVMQLQEESLPKAAVMPPGKSRKPFLMYELDNIRKQMPQEKNLRHFETAMELHLQRNEFKNRFCGGSHTKISAKDKLCSQKKSIKIGCVTIGPNM